MKFTVTEPTKNIYVILQEFVRCFLIVGQTKALLIDTGVNKGPELYDFVKSITNLPLLVYLTHADMDHTAGSANFAEIHINMEDKNLFHKNEPDADVKLIPVTDGEVIDLGGLTLEAIFIPGHTKGSTAYLCRENGILFPGDSIGVGPIFLFGEHRNLDDFITSTKKLLTMKRKVKSIYPCHHTLPLPADYIDHVMFATLVLKNGKIRPQPCDRDLPCQLYPLSKVSFYYY